MKRIKKMILGSLMGCAMMVATTGIVFADDGINLTDMADTIESEDFRQVLLTYLSDEEVHSCTEQDLKAAYINSPFQIANMDVNGEVSYSNKIWYAPVTKDDEIISIITFVGDGKVACTITEGYVDILNRLLNESSDDAVKLFAFSGQIYGAVEDRVYNMNTGELEEVICPDIAETYIWGNRAERQVNDENIFQYSISSLLSGRTVESIASGKQLKNYPTFSQGSQPLCWAGTIASMVKYEFPSQYSSITINDVCKAVNYYQGASWDKIKAAMNYYFKSPYIPTYIESPLSRDQVKVVIGNDDPGLMSSLNPTKTSAHITALIGYKDTPSGMSVKIMNPGTGKLEWGYYSTSAFSYAYNNEVYKWDKTIRLLYQA